MLSQIHIASIFQSFKIFAAPCPEKEFFGFPTWYHYLDSQTSTIDSPIDGGAFSSCVPKINELKDFWLIGLAVIEILLRVGMLAAVFFVVYAGIKYTNSRGNPDKVEAAKKTLVDAIAGFVITVIATGVVSFIGKSFT